MLLWRCAGFKIFDITETHRKPVKAGEDSHGEGSGVLFQLDFLCKYTQSAAACGFQSKSVGAEFIQKIKLRFIDQVVTCARTQWFLVG